MKGNHFDAVAPFYDSLSALVFGEALDKAQTSLLNHLPKGGKVLIVGGGTGKILKHSYFYSVQNVDYVELSPRMIDKAKYQSQHLSNIVFHQRDFFGYMGAYDVIICNFFLDCFDSNQLTKAVKHLSLLLKPEGKLLVTDFQYTGLLSHRLLISLMHFFFRLTSNLQARSLQNISGSLEQCFILVEDQTFKNGLIFTKIFEKTISQ